MLDKRKIEAVELLLENKLNDEDIAKQVGISPRQFARWKKDSEFMSEWQKQAIIFKNSIQKDIERKMMANVDVAVETLVDLMKTCDNSETKRKCAESIIERIAGKVSTKVEVDNKNSNDNVDNDILDEALNTEES